MSVPTKKKSLRVLLTLAVAIGCGAATLSGTLTALEVAGSV